ncbi:MAG: ATP-binding cassette domain-containing protein [Clostridia bacterium]|nr:ATP-binding cassette domain-containing protein [Clostridia bacterium]
MEAIRMEGLCKTYGAVRAVDALSLSVAEGELLALLGLNGAGKTTTVRMLSCLTRADAGDAFLLGKSIRTDADAVKRIIGVSPQESATASNLTVYENLHLVARLYGLSRSDAARRIATLEEVFSLGEVRNRKSKTLSGGWQRRLSIAMAMVGDPKILFLDEPTLGLDVLARRELWQFIEGLKGHTTIILTTHYLEEAEALSDRVAIMANGRLRAHGSVRELMDQAQADSFENAFVHFAGREVTA